MDLSEEFSPPVWVNVHLESFSKFRSSVHQSFLISAEHPLSCPPEMLPPCREAPSECLPCSTGIHSTPGPDLCVSQTRLSRCSEKANIKSGEISLLSQPAWLYIIFKLPTTGTPIAGFTYSWLRFGSFCLMLFPLMAEEMEHYTI